MKTNNIVIPPYLKENDIVSIISPSGNIEIEYIIGMENSLKTQKEVIEAGYTRIS